MLPQGETYVLEGLSGIRIRPTKIRGRLEVLVAHQDDRMTLQPGIWQAIQIQIAAGQIGPDIHDVLMHQEFLFCSPLLIGAGQRRIFKHMLVLAQQDSVVGNRRQ